MTTRYEGTAAEIAAAIIARSIENAAQRIAAEELAEREFQPQAAGASGKFCNRTPPTWSGTPKPVAPTVAEVLAVPAVKPPRKNAKRGPRVRKFRIAANVCQHQKGFYRAGSNGTADAKVQRFQCKDCGKRSSNPVAKGWRIAE